MCERGINAAIGALGVMVFGGSGLKIPLLDILWSGTSQMFAMAGSNEALRYVSYPTQVVWPLSQLHHSLYDMTTQPRPRQSLPHPAR